MAVEKLKGQKCEQILNNHTTIRHHIWMLFGNEIQIKTLMVEEGPEM